MSLKTETKRAAITWLALTCLLATLDLLECLPVQTSTATATATVSPARPIAAPAQRQWMAANGRGRQVEVDSLVAQIGDLESRASESMADCARWFNLNSRLVELGANSREPRPGELQKRDECDALDRFYTQTRSTMASFRRLARDEKGQLEFASNLLAYFQELKYASGANEQLGREFRALKEADPRADQVSQMLEQLTHIATASALASPAESEPLLTSESAPALEAQSAPGDELAELDTALKQLIDRESELTGAELAQLSELGTMLGDILASGSVDLHSGRFRYLSGTLDAVRAVLLSSIGAAEQPMVVANVSRAQPSKVVARAA